MVEPALPARHTPGPGLHAGVRARDPTDANPLLPGGGLPHGQPTPTPAPGASLAEEQVMRLVNVKARMRELRRAGEPA